MKRREIVLLVLCILQAALIIWFVTYLSIKSDAYRATMNHEYVKGIKLYKLALRISPKDSISYYGLAHAYAGIGDKAGALDVAFKAVKKCPRKSEYLAYYGGLLVANSRYQEAEKILNEATKWEPVDYRSYIYMASNQYYMGKSIKEVDENCTKALQFEEDTQRLLEMMLLSSNQRGETSDAAAMCRILNHYGPEQKWLRFISSVEK